MAEGRRWRSVRAGRYARRLVIMVKEPAAGRVKTRLARDIGAVHAARFYRHTLAAVTTRLAGDPRWSTTLSVAPATALTSRALPTGPARQPQHRGDIGARMQAILSTAPPGPVVVIGTDVPAVRPAHVAAAFRALGNHDIVFGPAVDGGFWLVGMRRSPRIFEAFTAVRWSAPETLQDCLAGLKRRPGLRVAIVATLRDVDEHADLGRFQSVAGRLTLSTRAPEI